MDKFTAHQNTMTAKEMQIYNKLSVQQNENPEVNISSSKINSAKDMVFTIDRDNGMEV